MRRNILHIAVHLGGGAGKAISGLAIGLSAYYNNEILLLEKPEQDRYVDLCKLNNVNVEVISSFQVLVDSIKKADYVIFNWWGHPLSYKVYKALTDTEARVFLWSHVNGLHYPNLTPEFIELFDGAFFTSGCTYENINWSVEKQKKIKKQSEIVYGIGLFKPEEVANKKAYGENPTLKVGYAGTISYTKMNSVFPQICSKIKEKHSDVEIYMYGLYNDEVSQSFINYDSSLEGTIHFEGFVNDLESRLAELDIFCYPLNEENFATTENALLEAMAAGVPAVVLNNPPERAIITHGVDGLIANDANEMVEYVIELANNAELAKSLGQGARKSVIEKHDYLANASRCIEFIKKFEDIEKSKHNILSVVGDSAGANYLYFVNMTKDEYIEKAKKGELLTILCGESKGALKHYLKYYSDGILDELKLYG